MSMMHRCCSQTNVRVARRSFEVKYYEDKTYLSQSWQLYAEAGIFALEKIYNMGPTFRAEKSKTSRHLSEFWMAEMEAAWMDLSDVVAVAKDEVQYILTQVLQNNKKDLEVLGQDIAKLEAIATVRVSHYHVYRGVTDP